MSTAPIRTRKRIADYEAVVRLARTVVGDEDGHDALIVGDGRGIFAVEKYTNVLPDEYHAELRALVCVHDGAYDAAWKPSLQPGVDELDLLFWLASKIKLVEPSFSFEQAEFMGRGFTVRSILRACKRFARAGV